MNEHENCDDCNYCGSKYVCPKCDLLPNIEKWADHVGCSPNKALRYDKLIQFLKKEIEMREYICTTNHAVLLDNAELLLIEMGELK